MAATQNIMDLANNEGASLDDVAALLLDGDVRVDLINGWLRNGTNLNDAVAIMNQGVDLNLIGTSSNVGDFTGSIGTTPNEIVSRIPEDAMIEHWTLIPGGAQKGMKFYWKDTSGKTWRLRMHDPDHSAPAGSNAVRGWVLRVQTRGRYMDAVGTFYTDNATKNYKSPNYDPDNANKTHIPIQAP